MKKSCVAACPVEWPDGRGISGRMRVEWVAGSAWNRWSDAHGMGGQMTVESAPYGEEVEIYKSLYYCLAQIPAVKLISPGARHEGIIAFAHERCSATALVDYMRAQGVNCWPGYASHTPYYMLGQGHDRFVRLSINNKNNFADVEVFMSLLAKL